MSHVINGTRFVREETRKLVLAAIKDTGYVHNTIAKSLVSGSTRTIGLAISAITNFYFADIVSAIEAEVSRAGYTLLLSDTHDDPGRELHVVEALHQRRVDGVLLATAAGSGGEALRYLALLHAPPAYADTAPQNPDFETGSDLTGWTTVRGDAFSASDATTYWGGTYNQHGDDFLSGYIAHGDDATGEVRSSTFQLSSDAVTEVERLGSLVGNHRR